MIYSIHTPLVLSVSSGIKPMLSSFSRTSCGGFSVKNRIKNSPSSPGTNVEGIMQYLPEIKQILIKRQNSRKDRPGLSLNLPFISLRSTKVGVRATCWLLLKYSKPSNCWLELRSKLFKFKEISNSIINTCLETNLDSNRGPPLVMCPSLIS